MHPIPRLRLHRRTLRVYNTYLVYEPLVNTTFCMAAVDTPILPKTETIVEHQQLIERLNALTHRITRLRLLLKMMADLTGASDVAFTSPELGNTIFWTNETVVVEDRILVGNSVVNQEVRPSWSLPRRPVMLTRSTPARISWLHVYSASRR